MRRKIDHFAARQDALHLYIDVTACVEKAGRMRLVEAGGYQASSEG